MAAPSTIDPLRYSEAVEHPEPDEAATIAALVDTMRKISETTFKDSGHAFRSVHAKAHGLLLAELEVLGDLPAAYAQGLFAKAGRYPVAMRFSTTPGDILDDKVSTPRGLAIKVVGVQGERVAGSEGDATQDFVMVNGPAFQAPDAKHFLSALKLVAATTDVAPGLKRTASAVFRQAEAVVEAFGGKSGTLLSLGGHPTTNILGETFYSQVPLRFGDHIAKISVAPVAPELTALTGAKLDLSHDPDGIRQAVIDHFLTRGGVWEIRAQLGIDLETTPVEDASVVWPEDKTPYVAVGRITAAPQQAWSDARLAHFNEGIAFSPWHALAAHRPLGSVMRARKAAYEMSSRFRAEHNHVSVAEPRDLAAVPT